MAAERKATPDYQPVGTEAGPVTIQARVSLPANVWTGKPEALLQNAGLCFAPSGHRLSWAI
ncbi:Hypothetical predicted protein [Pelobates cultripes]|uniref:Uncharacterized protein n=1 Tax=Pelobates cultripes TaxID=61616 RepID=A0AAD1W8Q7_PELCU|nr:Hypothetical predicted protein [Pelobates cultripes]